MENIKDFIMKEIEQYVNDSNLSIYRNPIVGFADAKNPLFNDLKKITHENHLLPSDVLEDGKTVVSFFIPFNQELVNYNLKYEETIPKWAEAKKDTEKLINDIIENIKTKLEEKDILCSSNPGSGAFDKVKFIHNWSQRHVAYICGLGTFGINNMLITSNGCAGRYGSLIINKEVEYDDVINEEYCLYKKNKTCGACVKNCPVGALSYEGTDKEKCSNRLDYMTDKYFNSESIYSSCGKCICEPCAFKNPSKTIK